MKLPGRQALRAQRQAIHASRPKLISFNANGRPFRVGPNHSAHGYELQGADTIQLRRPVHTHLHDTPLGQPLFRGEENPAAADIQCHTNPADSYSRLNDPIAYVLTNGKPVSDPAVGEPSVVSTCSVRAYVHEIYHQALFDFAQ